MNRSANHTSHHINSSHSLLYIIIAISIHLFSLNGLVVIAETNSSMQFLFKTKATTKVDLLPRKHVGWSLAAGCYCYTRHLLFHQKLSTIKFECLYEAEAKFNHVFYSHTNVFHKSPPASIECYHKPLSDPFGTHETHLEISATTENTLVRKLVYRYSKRWKRITCVCVDMTGGADGNRYMSVCEGTLWVDA